MYSDFPIVNILLLFASVFEGKLHKLWPFTPKYFSGYFLRIKRSLI